MTPSANAGPLSRPLALLSPHPDDLCYSLGGVLGQRDCSADVAIAAFTISRFAPLMTTHLGDASVVSAARRDEDIGYWRALGAGRIDLGLSDCTVRSQRWQDWFKVPCDPSSLGKLAEAISAVAAERPEALVVAPLALGGNTDHIAVRDAALATVPAGNLLLYEDLPYAASIGPDAVTSAARARLPGFTSLLLPMPGGADAKLAAAAAHYPSQFRPADAEAIASYAVAVGGSARPAERVWLVQESA